MSYTEVTSNTVYPAKVSYQLIDLTSSIVMTWPSSFSSSIIAAGFNYISPDQDNWTITLPDATLASEGVDVIFNNISIYTFDILDNE